MTDEPKVKKMMSKNLIDPKQTKKVDTKVYLLEAEKGFSIDHIKKIGNSLQKKHKASKLTLTITLQFADGSQVPRTTNIYDNEVYSDLVTESWENVIVPSPYDGYDVLLTEDLIPKNGFKFASFKIVAFKDAKGGASKKNDCLFFCICSAYGGRQYLPKSWNTPTKLKNHLNLSRNDKISTKHLQYVVDNMKCNIHITGDDNNIYTSKHETKRNIHIEIKDDHYKLKATQKVNFYEKPIDQLVVIKDEEGRTFTYDGVDVVAVNKYTLDKHSYVTCPKKEDLIEFYDQREAQAEAMKQAGKKHDIYFSDIIKFKTFGNLALMNFRHFCQSIDYPKDISFNEFKYLEMASNGDIYYCRSRNNQLDHAHKVDINSLYPSILASTYSVYPIGTPKYNQIKSLNNKFVSFGLYHCKLLVGKCDFLLFSMLRPSKYNWYTHIDINDLIKLGCEFELIEGQTNFISYSEVVKGGNVFKPFVDKLYNAKCDKSDKLASSGFKSILNHLWGMLVQKKKKTMNIKDISPTNDYPDFESQPEPFDDKINYICNVKPYRNNWARIKPFLQAYSRRQMIKAITKNNVYKNVHHIKVDSIISTENIDLPISDKLGEWKIEYEGKLNIIHTNKIIQG
jgi:hypothetical protein